MSGVKTRAPQPVRRPAPVRRAGPAPRTATPEAVRLVQPALRVGAVNDPAEREAEAMAARVVAGGPASLPPDAPPRAQPGPLAAPLRRAEEQPNTDSLTVPPLPAEQQDFELPAAQDVPTGALEPGDLDELESGDVSETGAAAGEPQPAPPEEAPLAPARPAGAVVGREGGPAPADVAARVAAPGAGRPLPPALRARVEPAFGASFEAVRLHDGAPDRQAAARIGARAFTHGSHIWLGPRESALDLRLMAHELTHVVQQTGGTLPREAAIRRDGWIEEKGEALARHVPGYTLITVIVGRKLLSGDPVARTAANLVGGLFGLVPGGTAIFDRLNETNALHDAFLWIEERLKALNLTWTRVSALLDRVLDAVVSLSPIDNLTALFAPLVRDIVTFVGEIAGKVLEFIIRGALKLAGPHADRVWEVIRGARESLGLILENPLAFAKNLVGAVVGGFRQFGTNILDHLKRGLLGWLFGALSGAGIELPERLDFRGLMSLLLQILGLSYAAFRKMLVKKLGPRGERMVAFIERSVDAVKTLVAEGFLGLWQKILGLIDGFRETLIGGMTEMVTTAIVKAGIGWLAGLSNPVGAVVKVVLAIYDLIVAFIERIGQIMEVAQSIFASFGAIARGQVKAAADFVEQTIGRTVPVVLAFLAALLGLGGISTKVKAVFKRLQAPVAKALGKLVEFVVRKAKKLFSGLIRRLNGKRKLPGHAFRIGETDHSIYAKKKGRRVEFLIASEKGTPVETVVEATRAELPKIRDERSRADAQKVADEVSTTERKLDPLEKTDLENETRPQRAEVARIDTAQAAGAREITADGRPIDRNVATTSKSDTAALLRAREPRLEGFEGSAARSYAELKQKGEAYAAKRQLSFPVSTYCELDHTVEKQFPKALLENLHLLAVKPTDEAQSDLLRGGAEREARNTAAGRSNRTAAYGEAGARPFGKLGSEGFEKIDENALQFPAIAVYHRNHVLQKGKGLPDPVELVKQARAEGGKSPAALAKKLLKRQLQGEIAEIRTVMAKDPTATEAMRADVEAGVADLESFNNGLYAMNATVAAAARVPTPPEALNAGGGSDMPFQSPGGPDFAREEGVGTPYSGRKAGTGDFFEYDHIIDKAYPKRAQALMTLGPEDAAEVARRVAPDGVPSEAQARRLKLLQGRPLFGDRPMQAYQDETGWSVPLYRPIAKRVASEIGAVEDLAPVAAAGRTAALPLFVAHVRDNDLGAKQRASEALAAPVRTAFLARTEAHSASVRTLYRAQLQEVRAINPPERTAEVNELMGRILTNVSHSLREARSRTEALF